ncbi:MAG: cupredoxin domain-containing protein [Gammaproteobacteria bacterium]|nr:cupredoxin domain-containing protein [Gammaproteobacteria bacterium]
MRHPIINRSGKALWLWILASTMQIENVTAATLEVTIQKYQFTPAQISVQAGDTVRWVNREKRQYHSVWFEASGEPEPPYFFPDEWYEKTFNDKGTFPYRCGPHPEMTGVVEVK